MADQPRSGAKLPDPAELARTMASVAERGQRLVSEFLKKQTAEGQSTDPDPLKIGQAFVDMTSKLMADPTKLVEAQMALWKDYAELW